jgi:tetratricopeptide (TPR) repeat protein
LWARWTISLVTTLAFVAAQVPTAAFAQNAAQAEVLFKEGKDLLAAGNFAAACQRLTASFKLDPQPNVELVQGVCFTKLGKTASAYNAFLDASAALPRGDAAQKYAADQAKALESQLLKVKVEMQPTIPPGVAIRFDDETKTRDKDFVDVDMALDPGEHDVYVTAPGKQDYTKHFKLNPGETAPHTLIVNMVDKTKEEIAADQNKGNGGGNNVVEKPETSWSTVKTVGLAGMILGGAVLIGSGVTFVLTLVFQSNAVNQQTSANSQNPQNPPCFSLRASDYPMSTPPAGTCANAVQYHSQALSAQTAAIGLLIPGAVIGVAGLIMFLVGGNVTKAPEKPAAASWHIVPALSPNYAGLGVVGTF